MKAEILKKTIAFRIVSIIVIAVFFYIYTGSLKQMTVLTILVEAIKTAQYVIFELGWKKYKEYKKHRIKK